MRVRLWTEPEVLFLADSKGMINANLRADLIIY